MQAAKSRADVELERLLGRAVPQIDAEWLRALLSERVLKGSQKRPREEDLACLAEWLSGERTLVQLRRLERHVQAERLEKRFRAALRELAGITPTYRARWASLPSELIDHGGVRDTFDLVIQLDTVVKTVLADETLCPNNKEVAEFAPKSWRNMALKLAERFLSAMRHTNPTIKFGASNTGPIPRFIAAVAPHITGELPTVEAVATHLKRLRRRQGTNRP